MRVWIALPLALLLFAAAWPAAANQRGADVELEPVYSVVILRTASLRDDAGLTIARLKPYDVLQLLKPSGDDLLVLWQDSKERQRKGHLSPKTAAVVLGPPAKHLPRLKRIRQAIYPDRIKARLMAGRIKEGDNMWQVEMAWGRPERSFMVNYFNDEQHFVYLTPKGKPILLRFKGGALQGPLPASTRAAAAQVESPSSPR